MRRPQTQDLEAADYEEDFSASGSAEENVTPDSKPLKKQVSWDEDIGHGESATEKSASAESPSSLPAVRLSDEDRVNQPDITIPDNSSEDEAGCAEYVPELERSMVSNYTAEEVQAAVVVSETAASEPSVAAELVPAPRISRNDNEMVQSLPKAFRPQLEGQRDEDSQPMTISSAYEAAEHKDHLEPYVDEDRAMLEQAGVLISASPKPLLYSRPATTPDAPSTKVAAVSSLKAKIKERTKTKETRKSRNLASSPSTLQRKRVVEPARSVLLSNSGKTFLNTPAPTGAARPSSRYLQDYEPDEPGVQVEAKRVNSPARGLMQPTRASVHTVDKASQPSTGNVDLSGGHRIDSQGREPGVSSQLDGDSQTAPKPYERGQDASVDMMMTSLSRRPRGASVSNNGDTIADLIRRESEKSAMDIAQRELEMQSLKAQLFTLQNSLQSRRTQVEPSVIGRDIIEGAEAEIAEVGKMENDTSVVLSKEEYARLKREIEMLDKLVAGYQRENEKMLSTLKEKHSQEEAMKANFFDERENLNRELNMYKNAAPQGPNALRKSAEHLMEELEKEALVRNLRERIAEAESGAGVREKELQQTVDRIREENRQLTLELKRITVESQANENSALAAARLDLGRAREEVESLREKLIWYAENQELVDQGEQERLDLGHDLSVCKRELKSLGVDIQGLGLRYRGSIKGSGQAPDDSAVKSDASVVKKTPAVTKSIKMTRNPADIKRIKELESLAKDLKEALVKRHPDSLPALIQAANMSESAQFDKKSRESELAALREELSRVEEANEKKLRALRQEYEKIKLSYDQAMSVAPKSGNVERDVATSSRPSRAGTQNSTIRTLPKALERIR